jgi:hypothetical protein
MAKLEKYVKQVDYLWYHSEDLDKEQVEEYQKYLKGEIEEPDWVHELDFDLVKDKPGNDDYEFELIEIEE